MTAFTTLKIAVLAPIPSASVRIAINANVFARAERAQGVPNVLGKDVDVLSRRTEGGVGQHLQPEPDGAE